MKLLLFLTNDLSVSSVPSKYSTSLSFLLNSFTSSFSCSGLPIGGVGVNSRPLFYKDISAELNCMLDKFFIVISFKFVLSIVCLAGDCGLGFGPGRGPVPGPGLCPDPNLGLKSKVLHFYNFH